MLNMMTHLELKGIFTISELRKHLELEGYITVGIKQNKTINYYAFKDGKIYSLEISYLNGVSVFVFDIQICEEEHKQQIIKAFAKKRINII